VAAHNNLGLTYAAAGDIGQAHETFRSTGDLAAAEYNLGLMHLANGEFDAAARAFEQAITLRPDFTAAKTRAHAARLRLLTGRQ
jgi:tetratricopeptide (TPR) repeat protein